MWELSVYHRSKFPSLLQDIKSFLSDPKPATAQEQQDSAWADEPSDVAHLTEDTFDKYDVK